MRLNLLLVLVVLILLVGCSTQEVVEQEEQPLQEEVMKMSKVLFIIAQKDFRDEELLKPKRILENAGIDVEVASITKELARGVLGAEVMPDLAVKDADAEEYEYIVVVGGSGSPTLLDYPEVLDLVSKAKNTAAICLGPMVLAKAGVLEGKRATVFKTDDSLATLEDGGAVFVDQSIVVDGKLVTANGPGAADQFGQKLVEMIKG